MAVLMLHKKLILTVLGAAAILLSGHSARADEDAQPLQLYEEKIKAGLVYSFLKYTNWPASVAASPGEKLQVCLIGNAPYDEYLYPLEDRIAQRHGIKVTRISSAGEADNCNLILIHRDREDMLDSLARHLREKPVLTVSDISGFTGRGGMVGFTMQDNHIGFIVNTKAAEVAGLTIQDRLLKLSWPDSNRSE